MLGALTWWLSVVALLIGVVLLWLGLRGRRVDDHPVCRKCGRDLYGLSPLPQQCPECGVRLRFSAPRYGNRERGVGLVHWGLLITLPALMWLGGSTALMLGGAAVDEYKPAWLLAWELDGGSERAGAELIRRLQGNNLSSGWVNELVNDLLVDQAALSRPWAPAKGDFIEAACVAQIIGIDEWQRYVEQGAGPGVQVRKRVRAGQRIPVEIGGRYATPDLPRFGSTKGAISGGNGVWMTFVALTDPADGSDPVRIDTDRQEGVNVSGSWSGITLSRHLAPPSQEQMDAMAEAGAGTVVIDVRYTWPPWAPPMTVPSAPAVQLKRAPAPLGRFEVVPADVPTARAVTSQQMGEVFEGMTLGGAPSHVRAPEPPYVRLAGPYRDDELSMNFSVVRPAERTEPLPLAVAAEVWIEEPGGRQYRIADMTMLKGSRNSGWGFAAEVARDFDAQRVTVRLKPSVTVAESTPGIEEFWGEEVVWENVTVVRDVRPGGPTP